MQLVCEGCHLEELLVSRAMTKIVFAELMGVNRSAVTHWCQCRNYMTADKMFLACHILKCRPEDIYTFVIK